MSVKKIYKIASNEVLKNMGQFILELFLSLLFFYLAILIFFNLFCLKWSNSFSRVDKNYEYNPTVSIIIPCFNEENSIKQKLENIFHTSYSTELLRVYVIDDGSDDLTIKVAQAFKIKHNLDNLYLFKNPGKKGKASALNWIIRKINEEIVVITDADVLWRQNRAGSGIPI